MAGSDFAEQFADVGVPELMDFHGESVTRWPGGDSSQAATVTAIVDTVNETHQPQLAAQLQQFGVRTQFHRAVPTVARLWVLHDQTVSEQDEWIIPTVKYKPVWKTTRIRGDQHGLKEVVIERKVPISTERGGRTVES